MPNPAPATIPPSKKVPLPVTSEGIDFPPMTGSNSHGLTSTEVAERRKRFGLNQLPEQKSITFTLQFLRQFKNPLIYILLAACSIAVAIGDFTDASFIGAVLLLNALIGAFQEFSAEKSARALKSMTPLHAQAKRDGRWQDILAEELVPGDLVRLESGKKVPADLQLFTSEGLEVDESILTGESEAVVKDPDFKPSATASVSDCLNLAYAGTLVTVGRATGVVIATGLKTQLGKIADSLISEESARPPLLIRMELFTKKIAIFLLATTSLIAGILLYQGQSLYEVLIVTIALSVSAIPEGLPVALTIALTIASRRMAKRKVIVRKLPAVEALGSCTFIATDKTGTLTVNQMTVKCVQIAGLSPWIVEGSGLDPEGKILPPNESEFSSSSQGAIHELALTGMLCNEGSHHQTDRTWVGVGDAVDVALLVFARKANHSPDDRSATYSLASQIPFEAQNQYAATLHVKGDEKIISVKGALERVLQMCDQMRTGTGLAKIDVSRVLSMADEMANSGFRVLAFATKQTDSQQKLSSQDLSGMVFQGLVGMIDPLRAEAADAILDCHRSGIDVAMITGDHPKTALAIARQLRLASDPSEVLTGSQLKTLSEDSFKSALGSTRVFARVEPQQKLQIVQGLIELGKFVAVTGDGANDAPALKAANVGVSMGLSGTDVAKETSDLILADDRFASIVSGIEEGRIAYANIRKVIYLLISTGVAEIVMFVLAILSGLPLPLTAIQILWLNLVTNGIQHVALAAEPGEGDELDRKPRKPNEPIFDRLMLERIILSAITMGGVSYVFFKLSLETGMNLDSARNLTLLLMVLFENIMIGNCRSEIKSAFSVSPFKNSLLLMSAFGAQIVHLTATHVPFFQEALGVQPIATEQWLKLFLLSLSVIAVMEVHKFLRR